MSNVGLRIAVRALRWLMHRVPAVPRRENLAWEPSLPIIGRVADVDVQAACGQRRRRMSQACLNTRLAGCASTGERPGNE